MHLFVIFENERIESNAAEVPNRRFHWYRGPALRHLPFADVSVLGWLSQAPKVQASKAAKALAAANASKGKKKKWSKVCRLLGGILLRFGRPWVPVVLAGGQGDVELTGFFAQGKLKEKVNNAVIFDKATYEKVRSIPVPMRAASRAD